MAPPSTMLRLRDLDPALVARGVATQVLEHLARLEMDLLGIDHVSRNKPEPEHAEIYRVVRRLAGYARGDHVLDAPVQEYMISLIPLYQAPLGDVPEVDGLGDEDPHTELGLVILAAQAREKIEQATGRGKLAGLAAQQPLSTAEVAALASLSRRQIQQLVAKGELSLLPRDVTRWLLGKER